MSGLLLMTFHDRIIVRTPVYGCVGGDGELCPGPI